MIICNITITLQIQSNINYIVRTIDVDEYFCTLHSQNMVTCTVITTQCRDRYSTVLCRPVLWLEDSDRQQYWCTVLVPQCLVIVVGMPSEGKGHRKEVSLRKICLQLFVVSLALWMTVEHFASNLPD